MHLLHASHHAGSGCTHECAEPWRSMQATVQARPCLQSALPQLLGHSCSAQEQCVPTNAVLYLRHALFLGVRLFEYRVRYQHNIPKGMHVSTYSANALAQPAAAAAVSTACLTLTITPSCLRLFGALCVAPAGFTAGGSFTRPVTTSKRVGSEFICLNSFALQHTVHAEWRY